MNTILVTGGAGFIGCNFVRKALAQTQDHVVVVDKLTYAGNLESLAEVKINPKFHFVQADIADVAAMQKIFQTHAVRWVVNFAAETHVDRSIDSPAAFVQTNVQGAFTLLETARHYYQKLSTAQKKQFRFLQISTDEVFGSLGEDGFFSETTAYAPNSPYSASKAGADHLARSYFYTYQLPTLITHCSNNYGPYQFPEKLIPLVILNALEDKPIPIYGDGGNVRDWLHVEDHCQAILRVLENGTPGEKYIVGGNSERTNLQVVDAICASLQALKPAAKNYSSLKTFVQDRPGHDRRYAMDATKIKKELGWQAQFSFEQGIRQTVEWYLAHSTWCRNVQSGKYQRERLGLAKEGK